MSTSRSFPSSSSARETLASSLIISERLRAALPRLLLLHRSQWQCLASSYSAVTEALTARLEHACSLLEPLEQESMCRKLTRPLRALHQAVQEGETCMQESLPSSSTSTHSWLLEKALKQGMSTDVVDLHLHRLLWTSSIVLEQILRCAPAIEGIGFDVNVLSEHSKHLCDIWSQMDEEDDLLTARSLLNKIIDEEAAGDTHQLANFILQRLSCPELSGGHITDSKDLPPFLWVDPKDFKKEGESIGEGSSGFVQEAVWFGGRFAVKDFFYVEDDVAFGREATIQAQLHHPNVIPLVFCSHNRSLQKCSLVMERMEQDLHAFMMQRKKASGMERPFPDLLLAVDLMLQIAQGMKYLHSLHVIHRDIKSTNILVSLSSHGCDVNDATPHVHLKVADFGMARAKYKSSKYTTRQKGATPWRAPEVFEANPGDELSEEGGQPHPNARYTNKADVYSFGMVCYEILTGKLPFEGLTQVRRRVLSGERPILPSHCFVALTSYIERCWHADPEERPTFTQICRMFRYFKACIFMGDHDRDQNAAECNDWLLHPLPTSICARIDDTLQSSAVRQLGGLLRPELLVIPVEMYWCRVVLQQIRYENDTTDGFNSPRRRDGSHELVTEEQSSSQQSRDEIDLVGGSSDDFQESVAEGGSSSMSLDDPRRPDKGYLNRALKWLIKLPWAYWHGKSSELLPQRAELQNSLGLLGDFSYKELCRATDNFSDISLLGSGRYSKVYRGQLMNGQSIAVKVHEARFQRVSIQDLRIASQFRHRNIVPLFGWCPEERKNLLLVYEYMPNGDLGKYIFPQADERVVGWEQRYKIVGQVAAAIRYLHQDSYRQIIHRDVQPYNIMLDSEWNARLGDCGLGILLEGGYSWTDHDVMGSARGTRGYMDPEYVQSTLMSPASDVYSFGATVLEIATGRHRMELDIQKESKVFLQKWVWELYCNGEVLRAADVRLKGNFDESEMSRLLVLGLACMNKRTQARPTMDDVLRILSTASDPPPAEGPF